MVSRSTFPSLVLSCTSKHQLRAYRKAAYFRAPVGNGASSRIFRMVGRRATYRSPGSREILFVSSASTADSFRSRCACVRGAPEWSKQRSPEETPHVGQGTESNCSGVRSLFFIWVQCYKTSRKTIPFRTHFAPADCPTAKHLDHPAMRGVDLFGGKGGIAEEEEDAEEPDGGLISRGRPVLSLR
jgi:hypothetical protein